MEPSNSEIYALLQEVNGKLDRFFRAQVQSQHEEQEQIAIAKGPDALKTLLKALAQEKRAEEKRKLCPSLTT